MPDVLSLLVTAGVLNLREGRREISGSCPQHYVRTGKYDTHPSWSINKHSLLHFCQSCGYKGTLNSLLHDLTGAAPPDLDIELKSQAFLREMSGVREHPGETLAPALPFVTEFHLANVFTDVPDRLLAFKRLLRNAIDAYGVRWDRDARRWVLPFRSPQGELLGAQFRQKGITLTLPEGMEKSLSLFGYSMMSHFDHCVLVESPLDAVRLFGLGIPAISSLGAWVSKEQVTLMARAFAVVYMALDDDKAGRDGAKIATAALRSQGAAVVSWSYTGLTDEDGKKAKDLGDVASDDALLHSWARTQRWGL